MTEHASRFVSPLIQFGPEDCEALTDFDNSMAGDFAATPEAVKPEKRVELTVHHNKEDPTYSNRVAELLLKEYVEYACTDAKGADPQDPARPCVAYFAPIASLPLNSMEEKAVIALYKVELQHLAKERN